MGKMIVVMPGGFHPFHAGHYALYQSVLENFPNADVYVAATNDTSKRPFPFEIKERLAKVAGVKDGQFVQVKNPFQPKEILQNYNPEEDVVVFVRSEKDKDEHPKAGGTKKDGSPAYFQPYTGKNLQPFGKHGYMVYLPTVEFGPGIKSATEIRNVWPRLNEKKKLAMVMSLYPATQKNQKLADMVVKLLDHGMGSEEEVVSETKRAVPQPNINVALKQLERTPNAKIIKLPGGYAVVEQDDPRPEVHPNYKVIEKVSKLNSVYNKLKKERDELMNKYYWPYRQGNPYFRLEPEIQDRITELEDQITIALKNIKKFKDVPRHIVDSTADGKVTEGFLNNFKKKKKPSRDAFIRERLSQMSTEELRAQLEDYKSRLPAAKSAGSLVGGAVSDYANAIRAEIDRRQSKDFIGKNPDWDKNMREGIFDKFRKKSKKPELTLPKYPGRDEANDWMAAKAEYYAQHNPDYLPNLFSPASGDYLPLSVHVGSGWRDENLKAYRDIKSKYPDAVKKAKEITTGIAGRVSLSRVGDDQDYHGMSINEYAKDEPSEEPRKEYPVTIYIHSILHDMTITRVGEQLDKVKNGQVKASVTLPTGKTMVEWFPVTDEKMPTGKIDRWTRYRPSKSAIITNGIFEFWAYIPNSSSDDEKPVTEEIKDNPRNAEMHDILSYAKKHYPEQEDMQNAFVRFVLRSLKHSKEDSEEQAKEIEELSQEVDDIKSVIDQFSKVNEGKDYIQEK